MDFLKKFTDATKLGGEDTKETPHPTTTAADSNNPPSQTELFASAQVVAEAAKAAISRDPTNVDNYKLAGATADILDAAEHYGKLDTTTGVGSYFEKAEGYLKKYETSNSTHPGPPPPEETVVEPKSTTTTTPPPPVSEETHETKTSPPPPAEEEVVSEKKDEEVIEEEKSVPPPAAETAPAGDEKTEGGYGGALKAAGDFWKKN